MEAPKKRRSIHKLKKKNASRREKRPPKTADVQKDKLLRKKEFIARKIEKSVAIRKDRRKIKNQRRRVLARQDVAEAFAVPTASPKLAPQPASCLESLISMCPALQSLGTSDGRASRAEAITGMEFLQRASREDLMDELFLRSRADEGLCFKMINLARFDENRAERYLRLALERSWACRSECELIVGPRHINAFLRTCLRRGDLRRAAQVVTEVISNWCDVVNTEVSFGAQKVFGSAIQALPVDGFSVLYLCTLFSLAQLPKSAVAVLETFEALQKAVAGRLGKGHSFILKVQPETYLYVAQAQLMAYAFAGVECMDEIVENLTTARHILENSSSRLENRSTQSNSQKMFDGLVKRQNYFWLEYLELKAQSESRLDQALPFLDPRFIFLQPGFEDADDIAEAQMAAGSFWTRDQKLTSADVGSSSPADTPEIMELRNTLGSICLPPRTMPSSPNPFSQVFMDGYVDLDYLTSRGTVSYAQVRLEVCSGKGDWLLSQAKADPSTFWIGCDIHHTRWQESRQKALLEDVPNVAFFGGSVHDWLPFMADDSLDAVFCNYPEPDGDRQFFTPQLFGEVHRVLKVTRPLIVVSDSSDVIRQVAFRLGDHSELFDDSGAAFSMGFPSLGDWTAGSFFDSMWQEGRRTQRFHIEKTCLP
ncbi:MAG: uncharacterized protein KVP18_004790 [Porospora cf. gigantea A]|uniref:uncharacterized protein n=1 Tax=Porospora cf. gigantea A TaxID=2853593 RepID=UPI00355992D4|nr:MAG: hypothetical protein KVP18_004790 [Porospora cf. gigantea A]